MPHTMLSPVNKTEEEIVSEDFCLQENMVVHIISNLVDMPEFSGTGLMEILKSYSNTCHVIVMVSPFYPEEGRGRRMDVFAESLNGFREVYSFQRHVDEWKEDYSCQIRILDNCISSSFTA